MGPSQAGAGLGVFVVAGEAPLAVLSAGLVALGAIGVAVSATSYRDVELASIPRATSLLTVVQRVGASFGTVVIALVLHQQLAAGGSVVGEAFAHAFAWTLGFLAVGVAVVLFLPTPRAGVPGGHARQDIAG